MKVLSTIILLAIALWTAPVLAEYCERNPTTDKISCKFIDTNGKPHNASLTLTLTREGYSMMIAVFVDEWLMLGGETTAQIGEAEPVEVEYKGTRRDVTSHGALMEAAVFLVDKEFLQQMHQSKGMIVFRIATEKKDLEVQFWSRRFKKLDDFITETQAIVNPTPTG